ncbi:hypothetical protein KI387_016609, partial [Taxus chinensis]
CHIRPWVCQLVPYQKWISSPMVRRGNNIGPKLKETLPLTREEGCFTVYDDSNVEGLVGGKQLKLIKYHINRDSTIVLVSNLWRGGAKSSSKPPFKDIVRSKSPLVSPPISSPYKVEQAEQADEVHTVDTFDSVVEKMNFPAVKGIIDSLGKYIKIDNERIKLGIYTLVRIYVEINLSKGLLDIILLKWGNSQWEQVLDYENTTFRCRMCHHASYLKGFFLQAQEKKKKCPPPKNKSWQPC